MPNISYLSHVVRIDEEHVALSNQFFAKTAANVRANPKVTLILVDGFTGDQFLLDIAFVRSVDSGALFDKIARQLKASSAQVGMSEVMRLRSADIFRVFGLRRSLRRSKLLRPYPARAPVSLPALSQAIGAMERQAEADGIIDSLLCSVQRVLGYDNALVLIHDNHRGCLITTGSIGYERTGLGSEIAGSEGLIGAAAMSGQTIKVSDMSRVRRFGEAIGAEAETAENTTRTIAFPQLPTAMSQIAVPMLTRGTVAGVLFVESEQRLAFREEDEAALEILAGRAAGALRASEWEAVAAEPGEAPRQPKPATGREIRVAHHRFDDSVFVDGVYIVKGVAGALLRHSCSNGIWAKAGASLQTGKCGSPPVPECRRSRTILKPGSCFSAAGLKKNRRPYASSGSTGAAFAWWPKDHSSSTQDGNNRVGRQSRPACYLIR